MCEPASIAWGVAAIAGGAIAASAMAPSTPDIMPTTPQIQDIKQGEREVDTDALRKENSGTRIDVGPGATTGSTLLTGPGGIDPSGLSLNRNTLLGG